MRSQLGGIYSFTKSAMQTEEMRSSIAWFQLYKMTLTMYRDGSNAQRRLFHLQTQSEPLAHRLQWLPHTPNQPPPTTTLPLPVHNQSNAVTVFVISAMLSNNQELVDSDYVVAA